MCKGDEAKSIASRANDDRFYGSLNLNGNDRPDVRVDNTGYIAGGKRHEAISRASATRCQIGGVRHVLERSQQTYPYLS